jgi:purine-cytosine permease-like protein
MDNDVAVWKLLAAYLVWLFASVAIALIGVLLIGAIASLFGADSQSTGYRRMLEIGAVALFVLLAIVPFLVRRRMSGGE